MKVFLGEIDVPVSYGELNALIIVASDAFSKRMSNGYSDMEYARKSLDRLNFLMSKLKEFELRAEENANG